MAIRTLLLSGFISLPLFGQSYPVNQLSTGASAKAIVDGPAPMLVGPNFARSLSTHDREEGLSTSFTHNFSSCLGLESNFSAISQTSPEAADSIRYCRAFHRT